MINDFIVYELNKQKQKELDKVSQTYWRLQEKKEKNQFSTQKQLPPKCCQSCC